MSRPKNPTQYFECESCHKTQILKRNSKGRFCDITCQHNYQWEHNTIPRVELGECKEPKTQRKYLTKKKGYECELCGISTWCDKSLTLQIDHIDGNPDNNFPINLRFLCPNCHSQTPTYKGGNKKKPKMDSRSKMHRDIYERKNGCPGRTRTCDNTVMSGGF